MITETIETLRCNSCGERRPLDEFRRRRAGSDRRRKECRNCHRLKRREYDRGRRLRKVQGLCRGVNERQRLKIGYETLCLFVETWLQHVGGDFQKAGQLFAEAFLEARRQRQKKPALTLRYWKTFFAASQAIAEARAAMDDQQPIDDGDDQNDLDLDEQRALELIAAAVDVDPEYTADLLRAKGYRICLPAS